MDQMDRRFEFVKNADITSNSIQYLYNISTLKELKVPLLQTFYSTQRRLLECHKKFYLPQSLTGPGVFCQTCFAPLANGPTSYRIESSKRSGKFPFKILRKYHNKDKELTKYQNIYLKRMRGTSFRAYNKLVIICNFCKKQHKIKLPGLKKNKAKFRSHHKRILIDKAKEVKHNVQSNTVTPKGKNKKKKNVSTKLGDVKETTLKVTQVKKKKKKKKKKKISKAEKALQEVKKQQTEQIIEEYKKTPNMKLDRKSKKLLKRLGHLTNSSPTPNTSTTKLDSLLHIVK